MRRLDLIRLRGWSRLVGRPPTRFLGRTIVTDSIVPQNDDVDEAKSQSPKFNQTAFKVFESAAITFASIAILGISGYMYHEYYQHRVVAKIRRAFEKGDPSLDLAMWSRTGEGEVEWVMRDEQDVINRAVSGKGLGRYYLMIGEKGTGKTSMLLEAMRRVSALHCAMFEAHADPEIVRIRLGKAINYDYHEDYIGSLFSIRGPRDTTALLDIERAFDKLEEVALYEVKKTGQPLVLIVNSTHLLRDDADGENLVELLQQRAESFAASGLVTMIFNSDDYWVYERFKRLGTRLDVVTVHDLSREKSVESLRMWRRKYFGDEPALTTEVCNKVYDIVGGRPQFLNRVAQHRDMLCLARSIVDNERTWFLNQCGLLGMDMDDDVMESGKFSGSAMLLMKELVDMDKAYRTEHGEPAADDDHVLPSLPLWRARQVMTRADYIQKYDNLNIFTIDSNSMVRADSTAMMEAFRQIAATPGFDKLLEDTLDRVSQIESLGRTRELVAKDLVGGIGKYKITFEKGKEILVQAVPPPDDGDNDDD
ncbi:hypothetical protein POJ06DRAFT_199521 [Lipomyces tetrasporus]|uniref:AAA protein C-terminal winged helix domain-containing protein n=1 Tax=Lipomyces tetrasporus TaxID=54092 RepID=A0AAD7QSA5_9ASCO|nr:uncharacterized protein POJ06DRAFT_199521 [Lipomyces tetrasporus]KAJ8098867.1 hypothetical protein POJ06DRAFT_199521 [Lipomyces tetrasporus]